MKFNVNDRFSLGNLTGTISNVFPKTAFRSGVYVVGFDGHKNRDQPFMNRFDPEFFDANATLVIPPKPTNADILGGLTVGDAFHLHDKRGNSIWDESKIIFLGLQPERPHTNGTMIKGIRYGRDTQPVDLFVFDTDTITLLD